jgi:hypothetical protein
MTRTWTSSGSRRGEGREGDAKPDQAQQAVQGNAVGRYGNGADMTKKRQFCPQGHETFQFGRDSSYRCLECKRLDSQNARAAREAEGAAIRHAEREAMRAEEARLRKAERARIIAAGGPDAKELRWNERFRRTLQTTEVSLCQWSQSNGRPGGCFQRTELDGDTVYCRKHNEELAKHQAEYRGISAVNSPSEGGNHV